VLITVKCSFLSVCFIYLQVYSLKYIIILIVKGGEASDFHKRSKQDYRKTVELSP